jgi:hypothetical protein
MMHKDGGKSGLKTIPNNNNNNNSYSINDDGDENGGSSGSKGLDRKIVISYSRQEGEVSGNDTDSERGKNNFSNH